MIVPIAAAGRDLQVGEVVDGADLVQSLLGDKIERGPWYLTYEVAEEIPCGAMVTVSEETGKLVRYRP